MLCCPTRALFQYLGSRNKVPGQLQLREDTWGAQRMAVPKLMPIFVLQQAATSLCPQNYRSKLQVLEVGCICSKYLCARSVFALHGSSSNTLAASAVFQGHPSIDTTSHARQGGWLRLSGIHIWISPCSALLLHCQHALSRTKDSDTLVLRRHCFPHSQRLTLGGSRYIFNQT